MTVRYDDPKPFMLVENKLARSCPPGTTEIMCHPGLRDPAAKLRHAVRSLRGTAVLRWEYHPGSTLFFVWTQERDGSAEFGDFQFGRDRSALFRDRPVNVFQVKASYWLGI